MEKLIVYPADEGQAKALKIILKGMRIRIWSGNRGWN